MIYLVLEVSPHKNACFSVRDIPYSMSDYFMVWNNDCYRSRVINVSVCVVSSAVVSFLSYGAVFFETQTPKLFCPVASSGTQSHCLT